MAGYIVFHHDDWKCSSGGFQGIAAGVIRHLEATAAAQKVQLALQQAVDSGLFFLDVAEEFSAEMIGEFKKALVIHSLETVQRGREQSSNPDLYDGHVARQAVLLRMLEMEHLTMSKLERLRTLYAGVVADVLDSLGYRNQCLPSTIRPLSPLNRVAGVVYPAKAVVVSEIPLKPYELEIWAVDAMQRDDVLVVDAGDDRTSAFWGELLTTACVYKGVAGVVMTACTRDMWKIKELNFPVFGLGFHPADSKGRVDVVSIGDPITIGGVSARRGDLILGDEDGVVIIPQEVAEETLRLAHEKVSGENRARADLAAGMPMGEVFRKYGIL
jgi:regulator of RNase E activity RraA